MSGEQGYSPITTAGEYFQQNEKKTTFADRRANFSRASELVGPNISQYANRITDFNDPLATMNGFISAAEDALNGPVALSNLVGMVTSDAEFGGMQIVYPVSPGSPAARYERMFYRAPLDPETINFGDWVSY